MYTKCPECRAVFLVTSEQLNMAEGLVRCGICDAVFNGKDHIEEDHDPNEAIETSQQPHLELDQLAVTDDTNEQDESEARNEDPDNYSLQDSEQLSDDDTLTDAERIPTVIRDDFGSNPLTRTNSPIQTAVFTLGAIGLAIFLLGQISFWQNVDILPRTWISSFCETIGCGTKQQRDLNAIKILNRNIYTHPNAKKALMITTSFVNQSQTAQIYPLLGITLLDTHGNIIAMRQFNPKDYLVNKSLADTLMQPNQPVGARIEVLDPGSEVIAYEFEFH